MTYSFGYPVNLQQGQVVQYCAAKTSRSTYTTNNYQGQQLSCDMTQGSSGGPWLQSFVVGTGVGYVTSVNSFLVIGYPNYIHGPYFDSNIKYLWEQITDK
ncbi:unnamed protein product [Didymodactylos carnosus]|nr:unnamed protein product [Didymodactylos carnosus]CAF4583514.1 unnamed protein product [Didymodactylos carnosus]